MDPRLVADLIVRLSRASHRVGAVAGLTPTQWGVLRYFGRANQFSRTPSAYAAFYGTSRATASQAIKYLCNKGYLKGSPSRADARSLQLDLTERGSAMLAMDPLVALDNAISALPQERRREIVDTLTRVGCALQQATGEAAFGTCENCLHLVSGDRCGARAPRAVAEAIRSDDPQKLCVHFESGEGAL